MIRWRPVLITAAVAVMVALALVIAAAAGCSSARPATPATVRIHGTFDNLGLGSGPCVSGGDQVTVTDSAGKVIATADLPAVPVTKKIQGVTAQEYPWSAVVPVLPRYGITAAGIPPYYATRAQLTRGLDLSC